MNFNSILEKQPGWRGALYTIISINILRALAACLVVIGHLIQTQGKDFFTETEIIWTTLGQGGVGLFFVLSGFCIHLSLVRTQVQNPAARIEFFGFFKRRFIRLYPLHLLVLVLSALLSIFLILDSRFTPLLTPPTWRIFTLHLFMLHTFWEPSFYSINSVLWTLAIETHFYLIYPFYLTLRKKWSAQTIVIGAFIFSILLRTAFHIPSTAESVVGANFFLVRWWEWLLGAYLAEVSVNLKKDRSWFRPIILLIVAGVGGWWAAAHQLVLIRDLVWPWIFGWILFECIRITPSNPKFLSTVFEKIGLASYSLYLTHPVAIYVCLALGASSNIPWFGLSALNVLAIILITTSFYLFFEKPLTLKAKKVAVLTEKKSGR